MADDPVPTESDDGERDADADVVRTEIAPDPATAEHDLLAIVADLEGSAIDELPSFYDQVDHFVEMLYKRPPSDEAQMEISFSYAGYRISMDQQGRVTILNVKRTREE